MEKNYGSTSLQKEAARTSTSTSTTMTMTMTTAGMKKIEEEDEEEEEEEILGTKTRNWRKSTYHSLLYWTDKLVRILEHQIKKKETMTTR
jgi:hypothetical protein